MIILNEKANLSPIRRQVGFFLHIANMREKHYSITLKDSPFTFTINKPFAATGIVVAVPLYMH